MLDRIISSLSSTLTNWNGPTPLVAVTSICLHSRLRSRTSTWCSNFFLFSFVGVLYVFALNILQVHLFFLFVTIYDDIEAVLLLVVIGLRPFVILRLPFGVLFILFILVIILLPSRISSFSFLNFIFVLNFFFILFNLSWIYFNIIPSILARADIGIGWLFSPMMECRLLLLAFLIFELLLRLIIKVNLYQVIVKLLFLLYKVIHFHFPFIIFDLTCYLVVIYAFKVFLDCLFAILALESCGHIFWFQHHSGLLLCLALINEVNFVLTWVFNGLQLHECICIWLQMSDHMLLEEKIICSC